MDRYNERLKQDAWGWFEQKLLKQRFEVVLLTIDSVK
jgi:hypothetical protein